jgi:hypothetical protein
MTTFNTSTFVTVSKTSAAVKLMLERQAEILSILKNVPIEDELKRNNDELQKAFNDMGEEFLKENSK